MEIAQRRIHKQFRLATFCFLLIFLMCSFFQQIKSFNFNNLQTFLIGSSSFSLDLLPLIKREIKSSTFWKSYLKFQKCLEKNGNRETRSERMQGLVSNGRFPDKFERFWVEEESQVHFSLRCNGKSERMSNVVWMSEKGFVIFWESSSFYLFLGFFLSSCHPQLNLNPIQIKAVNLLTQTLKSTPSWRLKKNGSGIWTSNIHCSFQLQDNRALNSLTSPLLLSTNSFSVLMTFKRFSHILWARIRVHYKF